MADFELTMHGTDELIEDMNKLMTSCPDELNKAMKRVAKEWKKDCNNKMPAYYDKGKPSLKKNWKIESKFGVLGIIEELTIRNKAPHFHLVENGHRKFIHGIDTGGFVAGKHFAEKTNVEYEKKYPEMMQAAADKLLRKAGF